MPSEAAAQAARSHHHRPSAAAASGRREQPNSRGQEKAASVPPEPRSGERVQTPQGELSRAAGPACVWLCVLTAQVTLWGSRFRARNPGTKRAELSPDSVRDRNCHSQARSQRQRPVMRSGGWMERDGARWSRCSVPRCFAVREGG